MDLIPLVTMSHLRVLDATDNKLDSMFHTIEVLKDLRRLHNLYLTVISSDHAVEQNMLNFNYMQFLYL